jgi:hypothetical protein
VSLEHSPRRQGMHPRSKEPRQLDVGGWTIQEWCDRYRYSRSHFERMKRAGRAPDILADGNTRRITPEADAKWRAARESKSA